MEIVYVLIPISLLLLSAGVGLFVWSVKNGQYDDLEGPAHRILFDDDEDMVPPEAKVPEARQNAPKKHDSDSRN
ncbi:cbb3-type cytochrome oxidase assembly protein CcoS [Marinobacteraceae bacterium S3BR75-40.1]